MLLKLNIYFCKRKMQLLTTYNKLCLYTLYSFTYINFWYFSDKFIYFQSSSIIGCSSYPIDNKKNVNSTNE